LYKIPKYYSNYINNRKKKSKSLIRDKSNKISLINNNHNITLYNGDCLSILPMLDLSNCIIVTDPPFNIGYHYKSYKDKLPEKEYLSNLKFLFNLCPSVVIHYPETLYKISLYLNTAPTRVVSWVYNSNTGKQHRDIAFFNVKPDFRKVIQPYKNLNDKRIKERIARGILGGKLYDWWNVNQVKNVSKEKTGHPCQMPLEVMTNIIGILPEEYTIIDPFMGSGTTGVACAKLNRKFIGIEIDTDYFNICVDRVNVK